MKGSRESKRKTQAGRKVMGQLPLPDTLPNRDLWEGGVGECTHARNHRGEKT